MNYLLKIVLREVNVKTIPQFHTKPDHISFMFINVTIL